MMNDTQQFREKMVKTSIFIMCMLLPSISFAHTNDDGVGFVSGLLHPILGTDHLLAMLSVGIVSAQMGKRQIWIIPALFVFSMIYGGVLGFNKLSIPYVEAGIALSVLLLGIAILLENHKVMRWVVPIMVMVFGILHGYAHGLEMPGSASPVFYSLGFIMATTSIHITGVIIGHFFTKDSIKSTWIRMIGVGMTGAGVFILAGVLR